MEINFRKMKSVLIAMLLMTSALFMVVMNVYADGEVPHDTTVFEGSALLD